MLSREKLVNILIFMERASSTGKEAMAWTQTYEAVQAEVIARDTPSIRSAVAEDIL